MALPKGPLTNFDLEKYAKKLKIPKFKGVFMRDNLPVTSGPDKFERAIVNLDSIVGVGTHWVAYKKLGSVTYYYDSFGDLPPPTELVNYLYAGITPTNTILYNYNRDQSFDSVICGHLCLKFLADKTQ